MNNGIKTSGGYIFEDDCFSAVLCHDFGEMTDEQRARLCARQISIFNFDIIPEEIQAFVNKWQSKIRDEKYKSTCYIKNARIEFGYGDRVYAITPKTFFVVDGTIEAAANDILYELKTMGCNYGRYTGYLD
ncbi:MAG: hypothetical protein MJ089_09015 [Ruminococcus sp.]|nr:hypothetical protein [Ruminococcus sp.]